MLRASQNIFEHLLSMLIISWLLFVSSSRVNQDVCCEALASSGLSHVYSSGSSVYSGRILSYWSVTAQLRPNCIVLPKNTREVSLAVKVLVERTHCNFAIRSGGHSSNAYWNNIDHGVTIDMGLMHVIEYNSSTRLASVEPGANWLNVYRTLEPQGVNVPGGRIGNVGVGGFLAGGGLSYYLYRHGLSCDNVHSFEIVLASGEIVEASAATNPDLFLALKGGGNAFGIVTRFDLETFPVRPIWAGAREYPESAGLAHIQALKTWTDNIHQYPDGSTVLVWTHRFLAEEAIILSVLHDTAGAEQAPAFDLFFEIPGNLSDSMQMTNMTDLALISQTSGKRNIWFTLTLMNEVHVLAKAVELHGKLVSDMKNDLNSDDFETQCLLQPFPKSLGQISVAKGNNILGIDKQTDNGVILLGSLAVSTAQEERIGRARMLSWKHKLEAYSMRQGGLLEFLYMNYADCSQDVLKGYGERNERFMRSVSKRYDAQGVFQTRVSGGFKFSQPNICSSRSNE